MKRLLILSVAVVLFGCGGCRTARGPSALKVSLFPDGKISVRGRVVALQDVGRELKQAGARPSTSITVALPQGATQADMMQVTKRLRQAGYIRVLFTRPREVHVAR